MGVYGLLIYGKPNGGVRDFVLPHQTPASGVCERQEGAFFKLQSSVFCLTFLKVLLDFTKSL